MTDKPTPEEVEKLLYPIIRMVNDGGGLSLDQCSAIIDGMRALSARVAELESQQSPAQGMRVKPLEWSFFDASTWWAETVGGLYRINERGDGAVILAKDADIMRYIDDNGDDWGGWPSIDHAKAAAQADYERRILSAIEPAPTTAQQAAEVLLEVMAGDVEWERIGRAGLWNVVNRQTFRAALTAIATQEGETGNE